jgi:hypothetical protein
LTSWIVKLVGSELTASQVMVWDESPLDQTDPEVGDVTRIAAVTVRRERRAKIIMWKECA